MTQPTIDWTQAPEDATHAGYASGELFFYKDIQLNYYRFFGQGRWRVVPGQPIAETLFPRPPAPAPAPPAPAKQPEITTEQLLDTWMIEIATLTGCLYGWMESDGYKPTYEYIAEVMAGHDAQRGGCLRLSIEVMRILDRIIDWNPHDGGPGVFSYDHLEDVCRGVPCLLIELMTQDDWAQLAGNHVIPADLEKWLTQYVRDADDLRLLHDPDREASIALFQAEMDVPRAIAERAYKMGWRKSA